MIGPIVLLVEADNAIAVIAYDDTKVEQRSERYNVGAVSIQKKNILSIIYLRGVRTERWRPTSYSEERSHSMTAAVGLAWDRQPWAAVQRATWKTLRMRAGDEAA